MREYTSSCPPYSRHGRLRACQRAIRDGHVQAALDHGQAFNAGDGVVAYWLSRKAVAVARRRFGVRVDAYTNSAVLVGADGAIVTAYKVGHRKPNWRTSGRIA